MGAKSEGVVVGVAPIHVTVDNVHEKLVTTIRVWVTSPVPTGAVEANA